MARSKHYFFITGLPRTRTAWLANFLTYGDKSLCYHEAFADGDIETVFGMTKCDYIGNSDCGNTYFLSSIRTLYPNAVHVLIKRPAGEVKVSLGKLLNEDVNDTVDKLSAHIEDYERITRPLVVDFKDLDSENIIRKIWGACLPEIPFDKPRWEMLRMMNVQITKERLADLKRRWG